MKIAVLMSGEYRTFKQCRKTMSFLALPEVDVYFSAWDKTYYDCPKIDLLVEESVSQDIIISDLGFVPKNIVIESVDDFIEKKYNSKMVHRWVKGFEQIKLSEISYDYVIVTRPDLFFENIINFDNIHRYKDSLGTIWTNSISEGKLADVVLISSWTIMKDIFENLSVESWNNSKENDWHIWWYEFCITKAKNIIQATEFERCTFYRYFTKSTATTLNEVIQGQFDWRDLRLLHQCDMWGREHANKHWPPEILENAERKWIEGYYDKYKNYGKDNL